jgi:hypothetical protein
MEEEKLKQLRIISEQNKAKKAAAAAAATKPKQNDYALPKNYQEEYLAKDGSAQVYT